MQAHDVDELVLELRVVDTLVMRSRARPAAAER